jgi:chromosome segregation ATPase
MTSSEYEQLVDLLTRRFSEMDRRFDHVDQRFDHVDERFAQINERFSGVDRRFEEIGRQLGEFGRQFGEIDRRFSEVAHHLGELGRRIDTMEARITELRGEMLGHFDEIYRRLERLDQEYLAITQALRRIEARLTDEHERREIIERDLADLKQHVAGLQARIAVLEQRLDA